MSDVDHAKRALEMLEDVRAEQGTERGLRIAEAQVYATLALVEAVTSARPAGARMQDEGMSLKGQPGPWSPRARSDR